MKHVAAALLLSAAGKEVTEKSITEVLASAGIKPDTKVVALVVAACKGKKPEQV
jgi:ribosomal protein L12E/L44/L45/RPP1/RPP2